MATSSAAMPAGAGAADTAVEAATRRFRAALVLDEAAWVGFR